MRPLTRRGLLAGAALAAGSGAASSAYALALEPGFRMVVREYRLPVAGWGTRPPMTICVVTDLHAGEFWMPLERVGRIVDAANALRPDLHVVLGDLRGSSSRQPGSRPLGATTAEIVSPLSRLRAPLGTFAVMGNHDWWDDLEAVNSRRGPPRAGRLLAEAGIPVLSNRGVLLPHGGSGPVDGQGVGVWLCGTDSQWALWDWGRREGLDDLDAALAPLVGSDTPAVLLIHEPDLFARVPARVAVTLAGHTHGGQVRLLGWSPIVPSRYGNRYAYGLVEENGRRLVVSGGLGCSNLPVRLGVPPEITLVHLAA